MISLAGEKNWRAAYTVAIPGNYLLSVLWAGRPVKGCPLIVEAKGGADASKVRIHSAFCYIIIINTLCRYFVRVKVYAKVLLVKKFVLGLTLGGLDLVNSLPIALVPEK